MQFKWGKNNLDNICTNKLMAIFTGKKLESWQAVLPRISRIREWHFMF